MMISETVKFSF